jgi:hypothetical protein
MYEIVFQNACFKENLYVAKMLFFVIKFNTSNPIDFQMLFVRVCHRGKLNVAKWLLQINPDIDISAGSESAFRNACYYGHLSVAQWLLEVCPDIDMSVYNEYAFHYACVNGHLLVAQWLLSVKPTINISILEDLTFSNACLSGHLLVAQWLLTVNPDINISKNNEYIFRRVCQYGQLNVAQWLLQVKPDINISAENESAFRNTCDNAFLTDSRLNINLKRTIIRTPLSLQHLEIAKWLQSLKPYLYKIEYSTDNYNYYYICSKEEERWQRRKQLVWLASNDSPDKNNLFYRIPEDVSRYIIQMYL